MYSDTMFSKVAAQVWTNRQGFSLFYPIKSKELAHTTIHDFNAIPTFVITDGAMEETGGAREKEMNHFRIKQKWLEPYSKWQNNAE